MLQLSPILGSWWNSQRPVDSYYSTNRYGQGLGCIGRTRKQFSVHDFSGPRPPRGRPGVFKKRITNKLECVRLWSTNNRGLSSNFDALQQTISVADFKPHIILLCETFINGKFTDDNAFMLRGYECVRRNRSSGNGGGVAIYYASNICCKVVLKPTNYECIWLHVKLRHAELLIATTPRPASLISLIELNVI